LQATHVGEIVKQPETENKMVSVFVTREIKIPHEITGAGLYSKLKADPTHDIIALVVPQHPEIKGGYIVLPDNVPIKFLSMYGPKTLPDFMFLVTKAGNTEEDTELYPEAHRCCCEIF
jgi:hypothetical protein